MRADQGMRFTVGIAITAIAAGITARRSQHRALHQRTMHPASMSRAPGASAADEWPGFVTPQNRTKCILPLPDALRTVDSVRKL